MPWYYAGPEAKPVGPVTLEELQGRLSSGLITPETFVIEQPSTSGTTPAWRRFREFFPPATSLPAPSFPPPPPVSFPPVPAPGMSAPLPPPRPAWPAPPPPPQHLHQPHRPTNACCGWGFGLGLASFLLAFACGMGVLIGPPALIICIFGLVQVSRHREQSGRGLAIAGLVLAGLALFLSSVLLVYAIPLAIKRQQQAAMEQNTD